MAGKTPRVLLVSGPAAQAEYVVEYVEAGAR